jgi:hypothetical protein
LSGREITSAPFFTAFWPFFTAFLTDFIAFLSTWAGVVFEVVLGMKMKAKKLELKAGK